MKPSIKILTTLLLALLAGLLYSNFAMKQEYDKVDKNDVYWTYGKILDQPFRYLKITGGNLAKISFEQSPHYSVRVLREWEGYRERRVKAYTKGDTLFVNFPLTSKSPWEKFWMRSQTLVRIFAPELPYVEGYNTNFGMFRMKQKSIAVSMSGESKFEVESFLPHLDTLNIVQKDTSEVVFEMSPEYQPDGTSIEYKNVVIIDSARPSMAVSLWQRPIKSNEAMEIQSVSAHLEGYSLLDLGHAQIGSLHLGIADSSAIILSGGALKRAR